MPDNIEVVGVPGYSQLLWNNFNLTKVIFRENSQVKTIVEGVFGVVAYSDDLVVYYLNLLKQ